jgi:hypothetical protein
MEPEESTACSEQPINISYPELENPVNTRSPYGFKIYFNIISHISLHLPRYLFPSGFLSTILHSF